MEGAGGLHSWGSTSQVFSGGGGGLLVAGLCQCATAAASTRLSPGLRLLSQVLEGELHPYVGLQTQALYIPHICSPQHGTH